jgi:hypothetical protein
MVHVKDIKKQIEVQEVVPVWIIQVFLEQYMVKVVGSHLVVAVVLSRCIGVVVEELVEEVLL